VFVKMSSKSWLLQQYFMLCIIKSYNSNVFVLLFNSAAVNPKSVLCSTRTINIDVSPSVARTAVAVDRGLASAVFFRGHVPSADQSFI